MLTKALLESFHPKQLNSFLAFSSIDLKQQLELLPSIPSETHLSALSPTNDTLLSHIHYSWFIDFFKTYPVELQELLIHIIPKKNQNKVVSILKVEKSKKVPSLFFQNYLKNQICAYFFKDSNLVFQNIIPSCELSPLLDFKKHTLINSIDLLVVYTIAQEVPKIVEKDKLKKVYQTLSKQQLDFLKFCLNTPFPPQKNSKLFFNTEESPEQLKYALHLRALSLFAIVLKGQGSSFIWHLTHKLDVGRGKTLIKLMKNGSETYEKLETVLTKQILTIIQRYFTENKGVL